MMERLRRRGDGDWRRRGERGEVNVGNLYGGEKRKVVVVRVMGFGLWRRSKTWKRS